MVDAGIVRLGFAGGVLVGGLLSLSLALRLASRGLFGPTRAARRPRRLPPVERTLLLLLVCGLVQYGATKGTGGDSPARPPTAAAAAVAYAGGKGEGARNKEQGVSADGASSAVAGSGTEKKEGNVHTYSLLLSPSSLNPAPYSLTDKDISRGYRLVSVVTNEAHSYAMPADARLVGTWHLTDAYDAAARVFLEGVRGEGGSSKEQIVSADNSSSVVAAGRTQLDVAHHTYFLLPTTFSFPLGGQVVTSLWAHVWGRARPQLWNASNELVAVGAPMCARRGVSRLWTAATTNGSVLLTWQDFFFKGASSKEQVVSAEGASEEVVRSKEKGVSAEFSSSVVTGDGTQQDVAHHTYSLLPTTSSLISAQLELFRDGSFVARSNAVARVYRRVNPDDWDGDGIPNAEDEDPRVAADEPRFGPRQSLPPGAHTNNYYWVDLAVQDADALVSFAGDAPSDLPDPSFVARAGETNRVTLLVGKPYTIRCLLPVEVVGKSSDAIEVRQEANGTLRLLWPVEIGVMEGDGNEEVCAGGEGVWSKEQVVSAEFSSSVVAACGTRQDVAHHTYSLLLSPYSLNPTPYSLASSPSSFTMTLSPPCLVGAFSWTNACCRVAGDGLAFSFKCDGRCACGGCAATGYFAYEGYRLPARGGACPCGGSGGAVVPGDGDDEEPNPLPSASARFSKRVILFEDEYEDAPGVSVPWRSTETELVCSASGGPNGGRVRIEARGIDGLVPYGGLPLPFERELGPFESVEFKNTYRAVRQSGGEGDIVVTATFEENGTGAAWTSEDRATAVRVTISPKLDAPENPSRQRHKFGVGEAVDCSLAPETSSAMWTSVGNGVVAPKDGSFEYKCPLRAEVNGLEVSVGGCSYIPRISVVEPREVLAKDMGYWQSLEVQPGQSGGVLLTMSLYALPLDVSFSGVKIEEIPDAGGCHTGYFADTFFMSEWFHGTAQWAGVWHEVYGDNKFMRDGAGFTGLLPQLDANGRVSPSGTNGWIHGSLTWNVPCGWAGFDVEGDDSPIGSFAESAQQVMTIDAQGDVEIRKHGNAVRREIGGGVILNGGPME